MSFYRLLEEDEEDAMDRYQDEADEMRPAKGYTTFILVCFVALITSLVIYGLRTYVFLGNKPNEIVAVEEDEKNGSTYNPPQQNLV
mmetsp:Transcript_10951/g.15669  ORF Transcript_10951/g.15669 Transcript_10951/m.15669 type:complete len:86 (-) Transcript_10951:156-413(-)